MMSDTWRVGKLAHALRDLLRNSQFRNVAVKGELTQYRVAASGHAYFSLKDEDGKMDCVAWRGKAMHFPDGLEDGMEVLIIASVDLYPPQGRVQLQVEQLRASTNIGLLEEMKRKLVDKLEANGSLDLLQRPLPTIPQHVVIVTGADSAALSDMLRIRDERWTDIRCTVIETVVQGKESHSLLPRALRAAYALSPSVVVVGRGGGSPEDLWSFNLEPIIEAILESPVPIVSAVGHESDHLVSDLVADHRAATPTHAMEMVIPIRGDHDIMIDDFSSRLEGGLNRWLSRRKERLHNLKLRLASAPLIGMGKARESLLMLNNILTRLTTSRFNAERQKLQRYSTVLEFTNPHAVLKRGYSMVKGEDGMVIRTAAAAASQSSMKLQFHDGELSVAPLDDD